MENNLRTPIKMAKRKSYPSDLSYAIIEPLLPKSGTKKNQYDLRDVVDALFYLNKTGCQWRMLPNDFPPYVTVSYHYHKWKKMGVWEKINDELNKPVRKAEGREETPSALVVAGQTVATSSSGGPAGFDGNKKKRDAKET